MAEELVELGRTRFSLSVGQATAESQIRRFINLVSIIESPAKRADGTKPRLSPQEEAIVNRIERIALRQRIQLGMSAVRGERLSGISIRIDSVDLGFLSTIGGVVGSLGSFLEGSLVSSLGSVATGILKDPNIIGGFLANIIGRREGKGILKDTLGQIAQSSAFSNLFTGKKDGSKGLLGIIGNIFPGISKTISGLIPGFEKAIGGTGLDNVVGSTLKSFGQALSFDRILKGLGLKGVGKSIEPGLEKETSSILESIAAKGGVLDDAARLGKEDMLAKFGSADRRSAADKALEKGTPPAPFPIVPVVAGAGGLVILTTVILIATRK